MAFTVTDDHARQEQVWEALSALATTRSRTRSAAMLTEGAVRASDKRAQFVGVDAYEAGRRHRHARSVPAGRWRLAAGSGVARPPGHREAQDRGRKPCAPRAGSGSRSRADFPYGHTAGLRRLIGATVDLTDGGAGELSTRSRPRYDRLEAEYAEADELPDEVDQRLGEIETALAAFENRPVDLRSGRDRPRRRLRQHRRRRRAAHRSRLRPPRGRSAGRAGRRRRWRRRRETADADSGRSSVPVITHRRRARPRPKRRRTTASSRCRIGSSPS